MASKNTAVTISGQITIKDNGVYEPVALDERYGPWPSSEFAGHIQNKYYGLTIGVNRYNLDSQIIGVDEYWWQPKAIYNEYSGEYEDGFVLKYPANNVNMVQGVDEHQKVLGIFKR